MASTKKNALTHVLSAAVSFVAVYAVAMSAGCSSSSNSTPPATKTTYTGTLYMASEAGGHIVKVPVKIDPSNTTAPITLTASPTWLKELSLEGPTANTTHVFHDVRLDGDKLYYSTIFTDPNYTNPTAHLGYVDVSTGTQHDLVIDAEPYGTGMVYCASGQTTSYYFPITMSSPAYIDAIKKTAIVGGTTLSSTDMSGNVTRTYVEAFRGSAPYTFAHGVTSPDGSKLFVAVNESSTGGDATGASFTGGLTAYLLKVSDVENGSVDPSSVTTSHPITGLADKGGTIAFRSTFTPDGSKILQAAKDRLLVLKGSDLSVLKDDTSIGGSYAANGVENHDAMPTPDGKYAILSMRYKVHSGDLYNDSGLQLYDLTKNQPVGDIVSTCNTCHDSSAHNRNTCGLVGNLQ